MDIAPAVAALADDAGRSRCGREVCAMENPRLTAQQLIMQDPLTFGEVWLRYWANGGALEQFEFDAFVHRAYDASELELDLLDLSLKELAP